MCINEHKHIFFLYLELVVAESVVVVTKLLKDRPNEHNNYVIALAKLLETIQVPSARSNILWLIGQQATILPQIGPDVLRQAVKNFANEVCILFFFLQIYIYIYI